MISFHTVQREELIEEKMMNRRNEAEEVYGGEGKSKS
jgi:hypothetical protein